jgi:AraC-like DNA-binding protein
VLGKLGLPLGDVLAGTGLTAGDLSPERFIPFDVFLTILENAVRLTGREDLGLLLGASQTVNVMGPWSRVIRTAATLGEALSDLAVLQLRNSSGAATYLRRQEDVVFMGYGVHSPQVPVAPVLHDIVLAVGNRVITELTHGAVRPKEYFSMRPVPSNPGRWAALNAPIRFGQEETGLFLSFRDMAFPLQTADRHLHDMALDEFHSAPSVISSIWTHRTSHALRSLILEGRSKMPDVAGHLGVGSRNLRRALAAEDTTFEVVRDTVRFAIARDLLSMSKLSVSDMALTLDFASSTAFIRAFRRWTGSSPAAWRESNG